MAKQNREPIPFWEMLTFNERSRIWDSLTEEAAADLSLKLQIGTKDLERLLHKGDAIVNRAQIKRVK